MSHIELMFFAMVKLHKTSQGQTMNTNKQEQDCMKRRMMQNTQRIIIET